MASNGFQSPGTEPLISNRLALVLIAFLALMAAATFAITLGGEWLGPRLALGGHSDSRDDVLMRIGQDDLRLPANTLRFREQRQAGASERIDLMLAWPEMQGYSAALKSRFDDPSGSDGLIFLQLSQSTMSRDMSGRVEPIYSRLFEGKGETGPYGLTLHRLRADSGYGNEVILTAPRGKGQSDYAVRCVFPLAQTGTESRSGGDSADCQRDIHAGKDLTVLYRFSSALLADWDHIDAAIAGFVDNRVVASGTSVPVAKMR